MNNYPALFLNFAVPPSAFHLPCWKFPFLHHRNFTVSFLLSAVHPAVKAPSAVAVTWALSPDAALSLVPPLSSFEAICRYEIQNFWNDSWM